MSTYATARPYQETFETIAKAYFGALADGNLNQVPYAEDVVMRAPLAAGVLNGKDAVLGYLGPLAGNLGEIQIREIFISATREAMAVEARVGPLHVLDKFVVRHGQIVEQQNFYDPRPILEATGAGELTADERSILLDRLAESRERIRHFLSNVPEASAGCKPVDGGWTILECAEHLVLTEHALLQMIQREVLSSSANPEFSVELQARDAAVLAAMGDRTVKLKTFPFLEPQGKYADPSSVLDAFLARRADTLEFVRATRVAVHHHAAPLEGLGPLDAYHWLLLMAAHTDRHLEQMRTALDTAPRPH
jgi:hypothetical protein